MKKLLAFHNDPTVKDKYLGRVKAHQLADHIIQGTGWDRERQRGCAVGCTLENYSHEQYPIELGIPVVLARIEDVIFEGLPIELAKQWPARFLGAIHPGADLKMVWPQLCIWILQEILDHKQMVNPEVRDILTQTIKIYKNHIAGKSTTLAALAALDALDARAALAALDARQLFWRRCADKLIDILEDTKK